MNRIRLLQIAVIAAVWGCIPQNDLNQAPCPCTRGWHCCDGVCIPNDQECLWDTDSSEGATFQWHTFFGGARDDIGHSIALDSQGNILVFGSTDAPWLGPSGELPLTPFSAGDGSQLFLLKLAPDGAYHWHTFYGPPVTALGAVTADDSGNIYAVSSSASAWQGPQGQPPLNPYSTNGTNDIVVLKLTPAGAYLWHTFYPAQTGAGIVADGTGHLFVTGSSLASWHGPGNSPPLNAHSEGAGETNNMVVLKLTPQGAYQWHTFYGGDDQRGQAIAVVQSGDLYLSGYAGGPWKGPGGQPPLHHHSGESDAVIVKLNASGAYRWHTFYGSDEAGDEALSLALDGSEHLYVTGISTACDWRGTVIAEPLNPAGYLVDCIFVLKLNRIGEYQWHTFYGANWDKGKSIAVDSTGQVYVTGYSSASWSGPDDQPPITPHSGTPTTDMVVLKLDSSGGYRWHAFFGGPGNDIGGSIAVGNIGDLYITGNSSARWNGPESRNPLKKTPFDGFVVKLIDRSQL